jgi:hypothetical protein
MPAGDPAGYLRGPGVPAEAAGTAGSMPGSARPYGGGPQGMPDMPAPQGAPGAGPGGPPPGPMPGGITPLDAESERPDEDILSGVPGHGPPGLLEDEDPADQLLRAMYSVLPSEDIRMLLESRAF